MAKMTKIRLKQVGLPAIYLLIEEKKLVKIGSMDTVMCAYEARHWGYRLALCGMLLLSAGSVSAQEVAAPRSFEAVAVSTTEIRCYWLPGRGVTGYTLTRDGQSIATLASSAQEYDDTGLAPDSTHRYTLQAASPQPMPLPAREYVERTFAPFPENRRGEGEKGRWGDEQGRGRSSEAEQSKIQNPKSKIQYAFDVIVVQASSGGVAAAITAAEHGMRVALIEPTTRLGGMPVNGLSATDLRRDFHASGFLTRFQAQVKALYAAEGIKTSGLQYSPRIAHQAMKSLLYETPNLMIYRRMRLAKVYTHNVVPDGSRRRIDAILVDELDANGQPTGRQAELWAKVFIDATDCGDLAAWAGAPFRVGREGRTPKEPHAGVIYYDRAADKLLPGSTGKADRRIQSYAYLLTVKDYGPGADKTIPMPPGYRKEDFIHTPAWKDSWAVTSGKMPEGKYELNQHPQGNDLQEINYDYPTTDYKERARIEKLYRDHVLGYLYYIQTEQGQKQIGLPDDEYRDSGGFPSLLYVREGRRILGEQLPLEADITHAPELERPESVGIGDYPMDSHAVERKTDWDRPDMGEGEWWLYQYTPVHQLPIGILIPQRLDNVWVTTAVSSTHVSFGTYRLEPVRMAFGEAAGIGAMLSMRYHLAARAVPARQIQDELLVAATQPDGDPNLLLYFFADIKPGSKNYRAIQYLAARGFTSGGEQFKPDAPTTRGELATWLTQLAARAAPPARILVRATAEDGKRYAVVRRAYYPYMGAAADPDAVRGLQELPNSTATITRAEVAHWVARVLNWKPEAAPQAEHYVDLQDPTVRADAEMLADHAIVSTLWDGSGALRPDGKLAFRPDAPLSHADLFETLYLAQRGLGPLFNDNPVDGRNGHEVPPALYDTVVEPLP